MIITWSGRDRSLEINLCAPWSLLLHRMPKIPDCNNLLKCRRGKNLKKSACPCNHHSWPRDNSCRKGVCGNARFLHGCLDVSYRSCDKCKKPWPCRNCTFPNSVHHHNLKSTRPAALCFPGPGDAPHWELCDFCTGMGSCYSTELWMQDVDFWSWQDDDSTRLL